MDLELEVCTIYGDTVDGTGFEFGSTDSRKAVFAMNERNIQ